jgi:hypothetical protein
MSGLNNHLNGLNAPTIFSLKKKTIKNIKRKDKKDKPCDNVGDDDDDDDEIEEDLLC